MNRSQVYKEVYNTRRWRRLRDAKLNAHPLCELCQAQGLTMPADMVHHLKPIRSGGNAWAWDNLQSLCNDCHRAEHETPVNAERCQWFKWLTGTPVTQTLQQTSTTPPALMHEVGTFAISATLSKTSI